MSQKQKNYLGGKLQKNISSGFLMPIFHKRNLLENLLENLGNFHSWNFPWNFGEFSFQLSDFFFTALFSIYYSTEFLVAAS